MKSRHNAQAPLRALYDVCCAERLEARHLLMAAPVELGFQSSYVVDFETGVEQFAYVDDAFQGTSQGSYADGQWGRTATAAGGGVLQVVLGGQDNEDILGMSGGLATLFPSFRRG